MNLAEKELAYISNKHKVGIKDIKSSNRAVHLYNARREFAIIMRFMHKWTFLEIAAVLERDHSTIINYIEPKKDKSKCRSTKRSPSSLKRSNLRADLIAQSNA